MARSARKPAREALSRERIEEAALDLIERDGLDGFSTRKLAAVLGCEAMSIYHYFPSKAHLTDALVDRFVAEVGLPPAELSPVERMRRLAFDYRAAGLRHPNFYKLIALHRLNTAAGIRWIDGVLGIFRSAGLDTETTARLFRVVGYYLGGAVLDETSGYAKGPSAVEPLSPEEIRRSFPEVEAVNPFFRPDQHAETFRVGLEILLDGVARDIAAAGKAAAAKRRKKADGRAKRPVRPGGRGAPSSRSSSR